MICYNNFMEVFTIRFCELLEQSARTQIQLADYIGVSRQCINDYKNGKAFPSLIIFKRMCEYFKVSADYLLGISDRWYLFAIRIDSVISESGCRLLSYTLIYLCYRTNLVRYYLTRLLLIVSKIVIKLKALRRGVLKHFSCHFKVWPGAAARRCQVLLDKVILDSK